jgi:sugar/nucleoside kinase (ribokinase family)
MEPPVHRIAVAGHLCLDIVPRFRGTAALDPGRLLEVGPIAISPGGSVANTGGALADLGAEVTPFASIGDDELGTLLRSQLSTEGFAQPHLSTSSVSTTSYSLVIEAPGTDRTLWHHTGANNEFDGTEVEVDGRGLVHVGYPPLLPGVLTDGGRPLVTLLARARAAGATTSLDLAVVDPDSDVGVLDWASILRSVFAECDIASPSLDDLTSALHIDEPYSAALVSRLADWMLACGVAVAAISAGRNGLHVRTASAERLRGGGAMLAPLAESWGDRSLTVPPLWVDNPVTTNGAGDASTAGLLFAISCESTVEQAAALAAACSAAIMSGARPTPAAVAALDRSLSSLFA